MSDSLQVSMMHRAWSFYVRQVNEGRRVRDAYGKLSGLSLFGHLMVRLSHTYRTTWIQAGFPIYRLHSPDPGKQIEFNPNDVVIE